MLAPKQVTENWVQIIRGDDTLDTVFWQRFRFLCDERNITPNKVMLENGLNTGNPTGWKSGKIPSTKVLKTLADYFGVTVDYLIGNSNDRNLYKEAEQTLMREPPGAR